MQKFYFILALCKLSFRAIARIFDVVIEHKRRKFFDNVRKDLNEKQKRKCRNTIRKKL